MHIKCTYPGCWAIVERPAYKCPKHAAMYAREREVNKKVAIRKPSPERFIRQQMYNNSAWRQLRAWQLDKHPYCAICMDVAGIVTPADEVDHITPHKGSAALFNDPENLQSLCTSCHSRKTAAERSGML